jgi:regulator of nucleoside diphosphate kinase
MPLPQILIGEADHDRLSNLVIAANVALPDVADFLERELVRARVVASAALPQNVVTMGSEVTFRDEQSGQIRKVRLVYPKDEDIDNGRMSILTPVGAALLGLTAGQSIDWRTRAGLDRALTVLEVAQPVEP